MQWQLENTTGAWKQFGKDNQEKREQQFTAYLFLGNSYWDWKEAVGDSSSVQKW